MSEKDFAPPPGPPPNYRPENNTNPNQSSRQHVSWAQAGRISELGSNNPFRSAHIAASQDPHLYSKTSDQPPEYEPPPGPPPGHSSKTPYRTDDEYAPPLGPPPGHASNDPQPSFKDDYTAPPEPPPDHHLDKSDPEPPPYDPWLAIPDTSLLPPPPALTEDRSPASNASWDDAARGRQWCDMNPLWQPRRQNQATLSRITCGDVRLTAPPKTKNVSLSYPGQGRTTVKTSSKCEDTILLTDVPLYIASTGTPRTVYFELRIISMGGEKSKWSRKTEEADASIAIGFLAPPYPSWRQPGWHRGSLGVHGDDGRRFVDDSFGGRDFTSAFRKGDIVGIGMAFSPPSYVGRKDRVDVFFTRNGKKEGGWNLHEERDREQDGGEVVGLEGRHDLLGAVGCFGAVEFEIRCRKEEWRCKPST